MTIFVTNIVVQISHQQRISIHTSIVTDTNYTDGRPPPTRGGRVEAPSSDSDAVRKKQKKRELWARAGVPLHTAHTRSTRGPRVQRV